jgi:anti-anti-sigma regulatory factor
MAVTDSVCLVLVEGSLDRAALKPCRDALDRLLRAHPRPSYVVVDLARAAGPCEVTVALLAAARRYLRARGVVMVLAAVPDEVWTALREAHVGALYDVHPTAAVALARLRVRVAPNLPGQDRAGV